MELLFDLVFVVAIASNSVQLHHAITEHHASAGILGYTMTWFAIFGLLAFVQFVSGLTQAIPLPGSQQDPEP